MARPFQRAGVADLRRAQCGRAGWRIRLGIFGALSGFQMAAARLVLLGAALLRGRGGLFWLDRAKRGGNRRLQRPRLQGARNLASAHRRERTGKTPSWGPRRLSGPIVEEIRILATEVSLVVSGEVT